MNDEERAQWLARLIDDMIRQVEEADRPDGLNDKELRSLAGVARDRLAQAHAIADASSAYESAVWQRVVERFGDSSPGGRGPSTPPAPSEDDARQFGEIIAMRKALSRDVAAMAAEHHDAVWERVQERIRDHERGRQPWPRADGATGHAPPSSIDDPRLWPTGDPELDSLVRVAVSQSATARDPHANDEALERLTARVGDAWNRPLARTGIFGWPNPVTLLRTGAVAAAVALVVAALGPLPATGLANHPAREAFDDVAEFAGVSRVPAAPPGPGPGMTEEGLPVSQAEAATLMGLPLTVLDETSGFALQGSDYFRAGITSAEGGVFVLTYSGDGGATLLVYQEAAGGTDLATGAGSAPVQAGDNTASYFEGSWESADGSLTWGGAGSQTLVFDRNGVRTILHYTGPAIGAAGLAELADNLAAAGAP